MNKSHWWKRIRLWGSLVISILNFVILVRNIVEFYFCDLNRKIWKRGNKFCNGFCLRVFNFTMFTIKNNTKLKTCKILKFSKYQINNKVNNNAIVLDLFHILISLSKYWGKVILWAVQMLYIISRITKDSFRFAERDANNSEEECYWPCEVSRMVFVVFIYTFNKKVK